MERVLTYTLKEEDLPETAGGLVNLVLKNKVRVTGHEISRAKYTEGGIAADFDKGLHPLRKDPWPDRIFEADGHTWIEVRVSDRIFPGQTLRVVLPDDEDREKIIPAYGKELSVLYEDEDVLVINKEAGVVCHPSPGHYSDTLANFVAGYLKAKGQESACRLPGRLDKETSGVLIFAKNRASDARLVKQREAGILSRTYLALVRGVIDPPCGVIDTAQIKEENCLMLRRIAADSEEGQKAVTHYEVTGIGDSACLVRIHIDTGRTHQIRVHMASIGHPLIGDTLYGEEAALQEDHIRSMPEGSARALLHAADLSFRQPFTGEKIHVKAPLPADFREAVFRYHIEMIP